MAILMYVLGFDRLIFEYLVEDYRLVTLINSKNRPRGTRKKNTVMIFSMRSQFLIEFSLYFPLMICCTDCYNL